MLVGECVEEAHVVPLRRDGHVRTVLPGLIELADELVEERLGQDFEQETVLKGLIGDAVEHGCLAFEQPRPVQLAEAETFCERAFVIAFGLLQKSIQVAECGRVVVDVVLESRGQEVLHIVGRIDRFPRKAALVALVYAKAVREPGVQVHGPVYA